MSKKIHCDTCDRVMTEDTRGIGANVGSQCVKLTVHRLGPSPAGYEGWLCVDMCQSCKRQLALTLGTGLYDNL